MKAQNLKSHIKVTHFVKLCIFVYMVDPISLDVYEQLECELHIMLTDKKVAILFFFCLSSVVRLFFHPYVDTFKTC